MNITIKYSTAGLIILLIGIGAGIWIKSTFLTDNTIFSSGANSNSSTTQTSITEGVPVTSIDILQQGL
jgi:hypothetical protein